MISFGLLNIVSMVLWGIVLVLVATAIFQYLWNITMPQVFNLKSLTYWLAFRLLLIAAFLTSGGFIHFNWGR